MARLTTTLELYRGVSCVTLAVALGGLLVLSPAEAMLGNVKLVYLHARSNVRQYWRISRRVSSALCISYSCARHSLAGVMLLHLLR